MSLSIIQNSLRVCPLHSKDCEFVYKLSRECEICPMLLTHQDSPENIKHVRYNILKSE